MLTQEEKDFLQYWGRNRGRRKRVFWQFLLGIPIGLAFVIPIVISFTSGWDKQASMLFNSGGLTLLVALLLIVIFIAIFSQRHKWDQYEQRYRELKIRSSDEEDPACASDPPSLASEPSTASPSEPSAASPSAPPR